MISFARALAFDPALLILDEATSSIDTETEQLIQQAIERVMRNRTSIVVAHRLSTIQRADRIIVLHHGEIQRTGHASGTTYLNGVFTGGCTNFNMRMEVATETSVFQADEEPLRPRSVH